MRFQRVRWVRENFGYDIAKKCLEGEKPSFIRDLIYYKIEPKIATLRLRRVYGL